MLPWDRGPGQAHTKRRLRQEFLREVQFFACKYLTITTQNDPEDS